ncbi:T9SS type A sorting domain-containing protein [candidate division WOR-3 bacterium]|nr:T9SS type A sorting domain-containing protein [candidate division WOR-3 bacterium]
MIPYLLIITIMQATVVQEISFDRNLLEIIPDGNYTRIRFPGCELTNQIGAPEVPVLPTMVALPGGAHVTQVSVVASTSTPLDRSMGLSFARAPVILSLPPRPEQDRPLSEIYSSDELYPRTIVRMTGVKTHNGLELCELLVYPVQYRPLSGTVLVNERITITIEYEGGTRATAYSAAVKNMVLNPEDVMIQEPLRSREMLGYVIITNSTLDTVFQRLADWKTKKGIPAAVRTTNWIYTHYSGEDNAARIRNYLKTLPDSSTRYVLLGGDTPVIPCRSAYAMSCSAGIWPGREDTMPADLYYGDLDGTWNFDGDGSYGEIEDSVNLYPDLHVGRAPVSTVSQAQKFVEKILEYEKNPDLSYLEKAVFAADILWSNPYTDQAIHKNMIEQQSFPPGYTITKLYRSQGTLSPNAVKNALRQGQGLMNHDGHGWIDVMSAGTANLHNEDFDTLTNDPYYGICASIGCWTTAYDFNCIAEAFMNSQDGGGVAFIGNSSYGWGAPGNPGFGYSDQFDSRLFYSLLAEDNYKIGEALSMAKVHYIPFSHEKNVYRWHQYQMNLLGDPEMPVWTATPETLLVSSPQVVPVGTSRVLISVLNKNTLVPVRNALVCIMKGNESYASGYTDASGSIYLEATPSTAGTLDLTVTAHNYLAFEKTIPVISGAYVDFIGWAVNDSLGNNDGIANPNEEVYLDIIIKNTGNSTAHAINLTLRTQDSLATLYDSTESAANLNPGDSLYIDNAFHLVIDFTWNGHGIPFDLEIIEASQTLNYSPVLLVGTALFSLEDVVIAAPPVMPGQTEELSLVIANTGFGYAHDTYALLTSSDPYVTVVTDSAYFGTIPPETDTAIIGPFSLSISSSIPAGHHPDLDFAINEHNHALMETYTLIVGTTGFSDDIESGTALWTTGGTQNRWHVTTHRSHSATHAWYCGDSTSHHYFNGMDCYIQTIPFMIGHNSLLAFYRWFMVPLYGADGIYVIVVGNGFQDTLDFIGTGGALDGREIQSNWFNQKYSLRDYSPGDTLQIRIAFRSDSDGDIGEGFYIDDFNVENITLIKENTVMYAARTMFMLSPNPFRHSMAINVSLANSALMGHPSIDIYDASGRLVKQLHLQGIDQRPSIDVTWDGTDQMHRDVPAGVYFLQLVTDCETITRKAILIR